ncbi:MAG: hypothetical protein ACOYOE_14300 [Chlorobium sp.]
MKKDKTAADVISIDAYEKRPVSEPMLPKVNISSLNKDWNAKCLAYSQEKQSKHNNTPSQVKGQAPDAGGYSLNISDTTLAWNRFALHSI